MTEGQEGRAAFRHKSAEIAVAALFLFLGALVVTDSLRLGVGWQEVHGPRPGYFPFYVGLIICVSAAITMVRALLMPRAAGEKTFVEVDQLKLVLTVLIPTAIYAALIGWIGIYVASILFMGFFMRWLGKYAWWKVVAVSIGTAIVLFLIFELWFKVPLPKGLVESFLGLD